MMKNRFRAWPQWKAFRAFPFSFTTPCFPIVSFLKTQKLEKGSNVTRPLFCDSYVEWKPMERLFVWRVSYGRAAKLEYLNERK